MQARQQEGRSFTHWWSLGLPSKQFIVRTDMVVVFLEDLGGHSIHGPMSLWSLAELRSLEGIGDARRGAGYLCQLPEQVKNAQTPTGCP